MSHWENVYAAGKQLNRYPFAEVVSFVKRLDGQNRLAGMDALDVGCGSGVHAHLLAEQGAHVTAFDGSPSAIEHAKALHPHDQIKYSVATLGDFDAAAQTFDVVVDRLSSTCAPVVAVTAFYQSLRASLKPGSKLFWQGFDTENSGRDLGHFDQHIDAWTGFSSGVFTETDTISFFSEEDLDQVFAGYDFVSKRLITDTNMATGYRHSYWSLELGVPG